MWVFCQTDWSRFGLRTVARCGVSVVLVVASVAPARCDSPEVVESFRAELRQTIEAARSRVFPALVNIQLVTSRFIGGKEIKGQAVGSGTIIDLEGHVLTNQHVTDNGRRFRCTLADKQEISARLVGEDPLTDLAVLKLALDELEGGSSSLPVAVLGDSSQLDIGDFVMAMGSPLALSRSVTLGIVSNTQRVFAGGLLGQDPDEMRLSPGQRTGLFTRWIQHDAAINPGNSGGPLVNLQGEVIGVNELGGRQMGFAIPSNLAKQVAAALVADGQVRRSWIGVSFQSIEKTGLPAGVLISSVIGDSPADQAGLLPGDVLREMDGEPVTVRFAEQLPQLLKQIADRDVGTSIDVLFERAGETHEAKIVTEILGKDRGEETEFRGWGFTALAITPMLAREQRLSSHEGVQVSGVRPGGPAATARPPMQHGDVIVSLDGKSIDELSVLDKCYRNLIEASEQEADPVLVEFERRGENYLTLLKPRDSDQERDPPPQLAKAWIGVAVQPVLKELAERLELQEKAGFRVTRIFPGTNAAATDLRVGDVITHLNDQRLAPRRNEDAGLFARSVRRLDLGSEARLQFVRQGAIEHVAVPLEATRIGPDEAKRNFNRDFELGVREITFTDRVRNRWSDDVTGVIVIDVESAGWAGLGGIQPGHVIQKVDDLPVADLAAYRDAMREIGQRKPSRLAFVVLHGVGTRYRFVEPQWLPKPTTNSQDSQP